MFNLLQNTTKAIRKLLEIVNIATHSKGGISYLCKSNASIASFNILDQLSRHISDLGTVIDVGANQGQFAYAVTRFFSDTVIHSFEPVPDTYEKLSFNTKLLSKIVTYNFGLGSKSGKIDFYQNEHSHASSALPISDYQKTQLPKTSRARLITVPVERLDNIGMTIGAIARPLLLKLDVQGYEKEVLLGAGAFMDKVDYLLFEVSFVKMYEGEPLFEEMHELVCNMGFKLIGPVGSLEVGASQIAQMDMLYARR